MNYLSTYNYYDYRPRGDPAQAHAGDDGQAQEGAGEQGEGPRHPRGNHGGGVFEDGGA